MEMENVTTVEDCMKMYQIGMIIVIDNREVTGFKEENLSN